MTDRDDDRARLSHGVIFLHGEPAVLAAVHLHAEPILALDLAAIGTDIDYAGIRIARDRGGAGADIAAAIVRVPERRRERAEIDGVSFHHVFEHRAVAHRARRDRLEVAQFLAPGIEQFDAAQFRRKTKRNRSAFLRLQEVGEDAKARRIALDRVEHQRRAVLLGADFGEGADLQIPIGVAECLQVVVALQAIDEIPQIVAPVGSASVHETTPPKRAHYGFSQLAAQPKATAPVRNTTISILRSWARVMLAAID